MHVGHQYNTSYKMLDGVAKLLEEVTAENDLLGVCLLQLI